MSGIYFNIHLTCISNESCFDEKCFCFFLTVRVVLDLDECFILVAYGCSVQRVARRAPQNQPQFLLLLMNRIIHQLQHTGFFRLTWGPKHGDQRLNEKIIHLNVYVLLKNSLKKWNCQRRAIKQSMTFFWTNVCHLNGRYQVKFVIFTSLIPSVVCMFICTFIHSFVWLFICSVVFS